MNALSSAEFERLGGWDALRLRITRDQHIRAARAITGEPLEDVHHEAILYVLNWFAKPAVSPGDDPVLQVINQATRHALAVLRSIKSGYHRRKGNAVRHVRESDLENSELFESLFGSTRQKIRHDRSKLAGVKDDFDAFCNILYRQRQDLYEKVVQALTDARAVSSEEMKAIRTAYRTFQKTSGVPKPGKAGVRSIPTRQFTIPSDAEILGALDDEAVMWTTPELASRTRVVTWEVEDTDGEPATEECIVSGGFRISPDHDLLAT